MPHVGELARARHIGYVGTAGYVWHACETCGKESWVLWRASTKEAINKLCHACATKASAKHWDDHPCWRGGRSKAAGYDQIRLKPDDFFYSMTRSNGYVQEHRLVMARHLGRLLESWEIVHHKNGIKDGPPQSYSIEFL